MAIHTRYYIDITGALHRTAAFVKHNSKNYHPIRGGELEGGGGVMNEPLAWREGESRGEMRGQGVG